MFRRTSDGPAWRPGIQDWPLVLLLACFGIVYAATLSSGGMFMWDEAEYASLGRSVARGEGLAISGKPNHLRLPVLPLAAAAGIALSGRSTDRVVKLPTLAFSLLALFVVYVCAATAYDRMAGLAAAALLGVSPAFWTSTPLFMTEIPFMALFCAAVIGFYFGLYKDPRYFFVSWLCWGLAFLTRYTAVLLAPVAALFLIVAVCARDADARRRIVSRQFFLAPCAGLALVAPWLLREQLTFGDALIGMKEASGQLAVFLPGVSMPWYFYLTRLPAMLSPGVALLALLGVAWMAWRRDRFGLHCVAAAAVIVVWFSCYRFKEDRQITSALPLLSIVAAVGLTKPLAPVRAVAIAALFAVNFNATRPVFEQRITLGYPSFLGAMEWLGTHSRPDAIVIGANDPQIFWYADRRAQDFPDESQFKDALNASEWVVITNFERGQRRYAGKLPGLVSQADFRAGDAALFRDGLFQTVLIRSSVLRARL